MPSISFARIGSGSVNPGDEVSFELTTSSGFPGFFGVQASLSYNADELSYQGVEFNDALEVTPTTPVTEPDDASGPTTLEPILAGTLGEELSGSIDVATVTFEALSSSDAGVTIAGSGGTFFQGADNEAVFTGSASSTVTIEPEVTNAAPSASDDTATVDEDASVEIDVLLNDSDPNGDDLTIASVENGENGTVAQTTGGLTYTPEADFNGSDSFTYEITDGNGASDTATVAVTVDPVNDAPVAQDDVAGVAEGGSVEIDVLDNDSDIEGDDLSVTVASGPDNGTAEVDGDQVSYTPNPEFDGSDQFTYEVSDGNGGTDQATVDVTVTATNDGPVAANDTASVDEDSAVEVEVLANDTDPDGDTLTVASFGQGASGTVSQTADGLTYTPEADFNGSDSFTYVVTDGNGETATASVGVTVDPVNDAPVAQNDVAEVAEDGSVEIDVLDNDSDVDGETPTIASFTDGASGTVSQTTDGLTYMPAAGFDGSDSFSYTIEDGDGAQATANVDVVVDAVNDAPVARDDTASVEAGATVTVDVLANDSDADGDNLSVAVTGGPTDGSVQVANDGNVTYTPDTGFSGDDAFTYTVSDGNGGSAQATVALQVLDGNEAPVIGSGDSFEFVEGDTGTVFTAAANDPESDTVIFSISDGDAGAFDIDGATGAVTFDSPPAFDEGGDNTLSFTLTASDGSASDTQTVSIEVLEDSDGDLVPDIADNAINVANADQRDTDNDNYGNVIDGDFDQSGVVGLSDLVTFRSYYAETGLVDGRDAAADADFNGDGDVLLEDLITFRDIYAQPLGESFIDGVA